MCAWLSDGAAIPSIFERRKNELTGREERAAIPAGMCERDQHAHHQLLRGLCWLVWQEVWCILSPSKKREHGRKRAALQTRVTPTAAPAETSTGVAAFLLGCDLVGNAQVCEKLCALANLTLFCRTRLRTLGARSPQICQGLGLAAGRERVQVAIVPATLARLATSCTDYCGDCPV